MSAPIHFYLTFNPNKNDYSEAGYTQAHEFYEYLKNQINKDKNGYAYWGKMISADRDVKVDTDNLQKIIEQNLEMNCSTHLYITDYKNIWVGKVEEVKATIGKDFKALEFYKDKKVEAWFKISDFTLLEFSYEGTAQKLSELYIQNDHMDLEIDEMSPFTSGITYPAFIQDLAEEQYFDSLESDQHLCVEYNEAVYNSGMGKVVQCLKTYVFPENMYNKIPYAARAEIEASELDMMESRQHNYDKIAFSYIKAFEIIINHLVIQHMKKSGLGKDYFVKPDVMPPKLYLNEYDGDGLVPIARFQKNYSINQLIFFLQRIVKSNRLDFSKAFSSHKKFVKFFTAQLQKILTDNNVMNIRGILAHSDSNAVSKEDALAIRNLILGIGCKGLIHEVYQSFYSDELMGISQVTGEYGSTSNSKKTNKKASKLKLVS